MFQTSKGAQPEKWGKSRALTNTDQKILTTIPMPKNRAGDITLRVTGAHTKHPKKEGKMRREHDSLFSMSVIIVVAT